jgi:hypothetical protein
MTTPTYRIQILNRQIEETEKVLEILRMQKRELESRAFIQANNIKREDVEFDSGTGGLQFSNISVFTAHLNDVGSKKI